MPCYNAIYVVPEMHTIYFLNSKIIITVVSCAFLKVDLEKLLFMMYNNYFFNIIIICISKYRNIFIIGRGY